MAVKLPNDAQLADVAERLGMSLSEADIASFKGLMTGYVAAWIGGARRGRAVVRILIGGAVALGATFLVGTLFGTTDA